MTTVTDSGVVERTRQTLKHARTALAQLTNLRSTAEGRPLPIDVAAFTAQARRVSVAATAAGQLLTTTVMLAQDRDWEAKGNVTAGYQISDINYPDVGQIVTEFVERGQPIAVALIKAIDDAEKTMAHRVRRFPDLDVAPFIVMLDIVDTEIDRLAALVPDPDRYR